MTNEDIISKAIEKAVKNGWAPTDSREPVDECHPAGHGYWFYEQDGTGAFLMTYEAIFSHDFAKAFWGDDYFWKTTITTEGVTSTPALPAWQHHLQELALAEDRRAYLAKFL